MKKLYNSFLIAFSMYSKIPVPQCEWTEENMAYAMCFFPWIGLVIGAVTWVFGIFCEGWALGKPLYTVILMMIPLLITGGIHLDGLLDTSDAMSSYQTRERRLEIMKDSNAGAFAVITCTVYFFFYYGIYSAVTARVFPILALSFMVSRSLSALSIVTFPKARKDGSVSAMARGAEDKKVKITMLVYLAVIFVVMMMMDYFLGLICYITALLVFGIYYKNSKKYLGGTTGDAAGCFLSMCEILMAFAVTAGAHFTGL